MYSHVHYTVVYETHYYVVCLFQEVNINLILQSNRKKCHSLCVKLNALSICRSFFGGGFGGFHFHFGGDDGGHREIPRGGTIHMDMEVSLEDLYNGKFIEV